MKKMQRIRYQVSKHFWVQTMITNKKKISIKSRKMENYCGIKYLKTDFKRVFALYQFHMIYV